MCSFHFAVTPRKGRMLIIIDDGRELAQRDVYSSVQVIT